MIFLRNFWFISLLFIFISFLPEQVQKQFLPGANILLFAFLFSLLPKQKQTDRIFTLYDWPVWLFILTFSAGLIVTANINLHLNAYLNPAINLCLLFYIGKALFLRDKDRNTAITIICLSSGLVALGGIIGSASQSAHLGRFYFPTSTQSHPTPLATYLLCTVPFGLYFLKQGIPYKRLFGLSVLSVDLICIFLTFSHRAALITIIMAFLYLWFNKYYKAMLWCLIILSLSVALNSFLPSPFNLFGLGGIADAAKEIVSPYRIIRMDIAFEMLKDHPWFGVGINNYRLLFDRYYPLNNAVTALSREFKIADNMYFTLLAETGIVGLSGFFLLMFALFKRGISGIANKNDGEKKEIIFICSLSLFSILIDMSGYELLSWITPFMLFSLICGFYAGALENAAPSVNGASLQITRKKIVILFISLFVAAVCVISILWITTPDVSWLKSNTPSETALMRIRKNEAEKSRKSFRIDQRYVPLNRISENLVEAVIFAEDYKFFEHGGVDWKSIAKSADLLIAGKKLVSGGSTITEQLAKNLFLATSKNMERKLRGIIIAYKLESSLDKKRILELYLNLIEWGDGIYGAEAAAQTYFKKPAADLTVPEAIRLAAIIPNPRKFTVSDHSEKIILKRVNILKGFSYRKLISKEEYARILPELSN